MHAPFSGWAVLAVESARVNILQLNVEGITSSKLNIIEQLVSKRAVRLILLQETHSTNAAKLVLPNYKLARFISSRKHGLVTFAHKDLRWTHEGESPNHSDIHWLHTKIDDTTIINVYKPPSSQMTMTSLPVFPPPSIYSSDFNCQHMSWGYETTVGVETASSNGLISMTSASFTTQRSHAISTQVDGTLESTWTWNLQAIPRVISLTDVC